MKKSRKLYKEKLNSIVQSNYVVIDIHDYNEIMYQHMKTLYRFNKIYPILNNDKMTIKK